MAQFAVMSMYGSARSEARHPLLDARLVGGAGRMSWEAFIAMSWPRREAWNQCDSFEELHRDVLGMNSLTRSDLLIKALASFLSSDRAQATC